MKKEHNRNLIVSKRDFEFIMRIFNENNIKLTDKEQDRVIKILNDNNISCYSKDEKDEEYFDFILVDIGAIDGFTPQ